MTLLKSLARLRLLPSFLNESRSDSSVCVVRGTTGPRTDGERAKSALVMWHHRQQCRPTQGTGAHIIIVSLTSVR